MTGTAPDAELLAAFALRAVAERYAMAVDGGDGVMFAAQFTEYGVLDTPRGRFAGRAALTTVPAMMAARYDRTCHAVVGQVPVFRSDGAEAQTYAFARHYYRKCGGAEFCYEMTIRYADRFTRVDGCWLLARRTLVLVGEAVFESGMRPRETDLERGQG